MALKSQSRKEYNRFRPDNVKNSQPLEYETLITGVLLKEWNSSQGRL